MPQWLVGYLPIVNCPLCIDEISFVYCMLLSTHLGQCYSFVRLAPHFVGVLVVFPLNLHWGGGGEWSCMVNEHNLLVAVVRYKRYPHGLQRETQK